MPFIEKFEDIRAWQGARTLTQQVYVLTSTGGFSRDYGLRDQLQRASVSTMANIAEGFDCDSGKEFARFLEIARRSAVEVHSLLYVALDADYIDQNAFNRFYAQAKKVKGLTGAFRHSLLKNTRT